MGPHEPRGAALDVADRSDRLFVVGIGASAGGLLSLKKFFDAARILDAAIVVIQHLDPTQPSAMAELLRGHTPMPLREAMEGDLVESGHVYISPPGKIITIRDRRLHLDPRGADRHTPLEIDTFLRSLAADQREKAIAVILTGTGSDGAMGVREVKANGGLILVEDVATAEHAGMPQAALDTGAVDAVLPLEKIHHRIAAHIQSATDDDAPITADATRDLQAILSITASQQGKVDFTGYKTGTIRRRIERRMAMRDVKTMADYASLIKSDAAELDRLSKDFLIGVTGFFRDPEAFAALQRDVLRPMLQERTAEGAVRVWVSACSTGEEAYSIAMLLVEECEALNLKLTIQVFATDANPDAVSFARVGSYKQEALAGVSPERLARFFQKDDASSLYRVNKTLRDVITFSTQNLLEDPPFSRLDLLCCRNVMIYLAANVQRDLLDLFHFALRPGGYLFLGSAENVPREAPFALVSVKWRIYRRDFTPHRAREALAMVPDEGRRGTAIEPSVPRALARERNPTELGNDWLLHTYSPAAVVINQRNDIISFHGPVERFLNMPRGPAVLNILALTKEGLLGRLRTAIRLASDQQRTALVTGAVLARDGVTRNVDIRVELLHANGAPTGFLIVVFEEPPAPPQARTPLTDVAITRQLEDDLKAAKHEIDEMAEFSEAANEELKAANEEMTSMNEELRSANEELESSKEELQSLNEELHHVNVELRKKVDSLTKLRDDLANYQRAAGIPTFVLDKELRITSIAPPIERLIHYAPSDLGRPLADIKWKFDDSQLLTDAARVMETLIPIEKEIAAEAGRRFVRRILPYRTTDDRINGVIVTFIDIEAASLIQDAMNAGLIAAQAVVEMVREPLIVVSSQARVVSANTSAYEHLALDREGTIGRTIYDALGRRWDSASLNGPMKRLLDGAGPEEDFTVQPRPGLSGVPSIRLTGRRIFSSADSPLLLSVTLDAPPATQGPP